MNAIGRIVSLNIGAAKEERFLGIEYQSAIDKSPKEEIMVMEDSIMGDSVADTKHHGGSDRAVCFYPYEHYEKWKAEWGRKLRLPAFGENVTVSGMTEENVYIGDIYQIGDCLLQITQGRVPCAKISYFNYEPYFLKKVMETGLTGYFARVIKPGRIGIGDDIILTERIQAEVSVLYGNQIYLHGKGGLAGIEKILSIKELAAEWQKKLLNKRESYFTS
ncbi:MOSC domain-containing protein [Peribacillus sp. SCS-155]|uniref:MOSC domain-containing protein n=1 Tax=Peribacillus sedimenti TaxID=3115297 RepID=UPI0039067BC2